MDSRGGESQAIPLITDDVVTDAQTYGAAPICYRSSAVRVGMEGVLGLLPNAALNGSVRTRHSP